jgi:hypothetical protein
MHGSAVLVAPNLRAALLRVALGGSNPRVLRSKSSSAGVSPGRFKNLVAGGGLTAGLRPAFAPRIHGSAVVAAPNLRAALLRVALEGSNPYRKARHQPGLK